MKRLRIHWAAACLMLLPPVLAAQGVDSAPPTGDGPDAGQPVGQAPTEAGPDVAGVLEERGLLTPRGDWVVEPALQFNQASTVTVSIDGFTLIPAIAVGLIDISEVQRDTQTASMSLRYGLSQRIEVGVRVPYVWRQEALRSREVLVGTELDQITSSTGNGLGDIEFGIQYQFNRSVTGRPFFIGNLRAKSRSGTAPYEIESREILDDSGAVIAEVLTEQPTGTGFWSIQPSLTVIHPTDPAVLFANISYLANIKRDLGEERGWIDPGDAIGLSFGMGIALNERTATSFGYDHSVVLRTKREHDVGLDPVFKRLQVSTLLWGISHRMSARTTINLSVATGVSESAPDVQVALKLPMRF